MQPVTATSIPVPSTIASGAAVAGSAPYPITCRGPLPRLDLEIPAAVRDALRGAAAAGARDAVAWHRAHPGGTDREFIEFVVGRAGAPPEGAAARAEAELLRATASSRTPADLRDAVWIDSYGLFAIWNRYQSQWARTATRAEVARAAEVTEAARALTTKATFAVKDLHRRERPFQADPAGIPLAPGIEHASGASYPSGHASQAYASVLLLEQLMPHRAAELGAAADQVAWSRSWAGAHFPSDIVTGAYIGAAAAALTVARCA